MYIGAFGFIAGVLVERAPRIITDLGWVWGSSLCALFCTVLLLKPLIVFVLTSPLREAGRRRDRIEASPFSLCFQDRERELSLRWEDVTDYYVATFGRTVTFHGRYMIVTRRGTFDFLPSIQDAMLLKEIIRRYAGMPPMGPWRLCGDEAVGGTASRWSGNCEGVGERIFHYRTRANRAQLGFLGFMTVLPLLSLLTHRWLGLPFHDDIPFVIGVAIALGAAFFWCCWCYQAARLQIDSHGITQSTPFGKRFFAWQDVTDYYISGGDTLTFGNVRDRKRQRIQFWVGIADVEELKGEIARSAAYCHRQSWQEKEKQTALTNYQDT